LEINIVLNLLNLLSRIDIYITGILGRKNAVHKNKEIKPQKMALLRDKYFTQKKSHVLERRK
jgi:hypothetical protein